MSISTKTRTLHARHASRAALEPMVGKAVHAPNLEDSVIRGENVVVTVEGDQRIARIEDIKHWCELSDIERAAGADEEWSSDTFVQLRLYHRRTAHSFERRAYPHLDRAVEVELEASNERMVWLPVMNVVAVAFVAHASEANAMVLGVPFDQPLANAYVIVRKSNGAAIDASAWKFFPDDGPFCESRYGLLVTHASRTKREWHTRRALRSLIGKLIRRESTVGTRTDICSDSHSLAVDAGSAAALFDLLSGTTQRGKCWSLCFVCVSHKYIRANKIPNRHKSTHAIVSFL